ncbi:sensor histidine kinase [Armatimonas sp.]|uniref:sensor histidine kinase n=1 Tax=Armatimonas sp. TaxID=1872638 RepID=UPI003750E0EC
MSKVLKTFRARLAFWIAMSALGILLATGFAVFVSVRTALQEKQDETLLEITRTEIESVGGKEIGDPLEIGINDESILVWREATGKIVLERGLVSLRSEKRTVRKRLFTHLYRHGHTYRALYYPYEDNGVRNIALCIESMAPMQSTLRSIVFRMLLIGMLGAGATCLLAWNLSVRLTRPLREIARQTASIHTADLSLRLPQLSEDEELVDVTEGINGMLARLESLFEGQAQFIADAAHELRSPLANLRTTAEVALRRQDPKTHQRALQITITEVERLTRLTESLLTLSLADAGALVQERVLVDIAQIITESAEAIRARAEEAGVKIELQTEPFSIRGDCLRLQQVFANLLDNAVRYSLPGGSVRIRIERKGDRADIYIEDEGPGISEANLPHVFERLWRADTARARVTGGFGLGLPIVKAIVEAHGGSVSVRSTVGKGTAVQIRFPLADLTTPH